MSGVIVGVVSAAVVWRLVVRRPFPLRDPGEFDGTGADAGDPGPGRTGARDPFVLGTTAGAAGARAQRPAVGDNSVSVRPVRVGRRPHPAAGRSSSPVGGAEAPPADLASSVDLLAVAVDAGSTVPLAVAVVGDSGDGPTARALRSVTAATLRGADFVTALEELDRSLGRAGRDLRVPLASGVTSGTPVGPALRRLADQVRLRRRRSVEQRIRRLPVLLLIPLCGLMLPAFVLLTLAPVGIATVADLDPSGSLGTGAATITGPP